MVALYPTSAEAATLAPAGGNPAETMHVTMVFLGDAADMKAAARAVGSVTGSTAPLSGTIGGVGMFMEGPDGYPLLAIPDVVGLAKLRTDLIDALAEENITPASEHDWVPHMTLDYVADPSFPDPSVIGAKLTFDQLSLVEADVRKDFPFDPQGSSDDVHRASSENHVSYSRSEQRRRDVLISRAKEEMA
jgi:2'-5' RNA ligase